MLRNVGAEGGASASEIARLRAAGTSSAVWASQDHLENGAIIAARSYIENRVQELVPAVLLTREDDERDSIPKGVVNIAKTIGQAGRRVQKTLPRRPWRSVSAAITVATLSCKHR